MRCDSLCSYAKVGFRWMAWPMDCGMFDPSTRIRETGEMETSHSQSQGVTSYCTSATLRSPAYT